jgi:hypothetical protein
MLLGIPTLFDVAPMAADIAASHPNKVRGGSLVKTFALNGVKGLHQRQIGTLFDFFGILLVHSPAKIADSVGRTGLIFWPKLPYFYIKATLWLTRRRLKPI